MTNQNQIDTNQAIPETIKGLSIILGLALVRTENQTYDELDVESQKNLLEIIRKFRLKHKYTNEELNPYLINYGIILSEQ